MRGIALRQDPQTKDRFWVHLVGVFCILSFATFPTSISLTKYVGEVPIKLSGLFLVLLIASSFFLGRPRSWFVTIFMATLLIGFLVAGFSGLNMSNALVESIPLLEFIGVVWIFMNMNFNSYFPVLAKYLIACLWFSMGVELMMSAGIIDNPFGSRASFSGSGISDIGLGRLVTPTHLLAGVCLGALGYVWISKSANWKTIGVWFIPAITISALASTRLLIVFIVLPAVAAAIVQKQNRGKVRLVGLAICVLITPVFIYLLSETAIPQLGLINQYSGNFIGRFYSSFASGNVWEVDNSSFYRTQESYYAMQYILNHPLFGGGFSSVYLSSPLITGNDFLGLHGNAYSHNAYIWLALKTGLVGLALFIVGLLYVLIKLFKMKNLNEHGMPIILLISILIVGSIWNIFGNSPDSSVLGIVVGLSLAKIQTESTFTRSENMRVAI
mgnify:CR=1 FL=1